LTKITSFKVMDILEAAIEMEDVIHLEVGEPDFEAADMVKNAANEAVYKQKIGYTHSLGIRELREAIANYYESRYGTPVSADNIAVTSGTSPALLLAIYVLLQESGRKEVLISNPGYACYPNFVRFLSGKVVNFDLNPEKGFRIDANKIREKMGPGTAALLLNSPSNPTGRVLDSSEYQMLANLGVPLVSDEIYQGLVYQNKQYDSILNYSKNAIVLNGFSKLFAMTGWRLGYAIFPEKHMDLVQKLCQNLFISANTVSQYAALKALEDPQVEQYVNEMVAEYDKRRRFALAELAKQGLRVAANPEGAYYIIIDVRKYTKDSLAFAFEILEKAHVAVTPGIDFGSNLEGYLRISYATSMEQLQEGIARLGTFLNSYTM